MSVMLFPEEKFIIPQSDDEIDTPVAPEILI